MTETDTVRRILTERPGPLLEVLQAIQRALGYVPESAVPVIAERLNLPRAEVHGVVTFHHPFRRTPPGRHTLQICLAESCQAFGCATLAAHAKENLGIDFRQTTPDGRVTLEPVYCLGLCFCSPAVVLDGEVHGRVTPERLDELLAEGGQAS